MMIKEGSFSRSSKSLDIEISNLCNIKCNFCPRDAITRAKGIMNKKIFESILNWIPQNIGVTFSGMGEPLINPNIDFFIQELKRKNIIVFLKTNGFLLTPSIYERLINSNVWHIQISIIGGINNLAEHGICENDLKQLEKNLTYISKFKNPPVSLSLVESENALNNQSRINFAKKFNIPLHFTKLHSRGGKLYRLKKIEEDISSEDFCQIFQCISFITWQGDILSCCHDITGESVLGNIMDTTYTELERIKERRIKQSKWFSICKHCDDELRQTLKECMNTIINNNNPLYS